MKLIVAVVQQADAEDLVGSLASCNVVVNQISSQGGFLRERNVTLLIPVPAAQVEEVLAGIGRHCSTRRRFLAPLARGDEPTECYPALPIEVEVGGATVFVLPIDAWQPGAQP